MKQLTGSTLIGRKRKHPSQDKENAVQPTPNTADLHTPQNTKGSQSSNPLVFGVFGNSLNSPLSIISKSGNLIKSSIRDGKGSEHILSVNKETCSQPLEYENFPLSDVTNVQQSKGKYPQRLYDSSFPRLTSTEQGHALITPNAKTSIFLAKDKCSQPVEIDRLPLSDLTNVQQPKGNYSQRLYNSSFSRVSSTQQGHTFITPTTKRTSVFSKETDGEAAAPAFRLAEQRRSVAKQHQYSDKQSKEIGSEAAPATRQKEEMVLFTGRKASKESMRRCRRK
nr:uncharacterized protein LOC109169864 [Ipomoea batatas]